jgi:hypothetical protein
MTIKYYKHRVDTVCNTCGATISSYKATTISKERRRSANDSQYIDSDESVIHTCEECSV